MSLEVACIFIVCMFAWIGFLCVIVSGGFGLEKLYSKRKVAKYGHYKWALEEEAKNPFIREDPKRHVIILETKEGWVKYFSSRQEENTMRVEAFCNTYVPACPINKHQNN